jgi:predicted deacylase
MKIDKSIFTYTWALTWPTVTILWWVHWNELSGVEAILKFVKEIEDWNIIIKSWKVHLILCNTEAIKAKRRQLEYNMNRIFWESWKSKEHLRVREIEKYINISDYLIDLHSTSSDSKEFLFFEKEIHWEEEFAKSFWISKIVNWRDTLSEYWTIDWSSNEYMHKIWWIWVTIECWNHYNSSSDTIAYNAIISGLKYLWIINKEVAHSTIHEIYTIKSMICSPSWNFKFKRKYDNFSFVEKWEILWYEDWNKHITDRSFHMLLPNFWEISKGEEIYFISEKE